MTQTSATPRYSPVELAILKSAIADTYKYAFKAINKILAPALVIDPAELRSIADRLVNNDSVWMVFNSDGVAHCAIQAAAAIDGRFSVRGGFRDNEERTIFRSGMTASFVQVGNDLHTLIDTAPITAGGIHCRDWEMMAQTLTEKQVKTMMAEILIGPIQ